MCIISFEKKEVKKKLTFISSNLPYNFIEHSRALGMFCHDYGVFLDSNIGTTISEKPII